MEKSTGQEEDWILASAFWLRFSFLVSLFSFLMVATALAAESSSLAQASPAADQGQPDSGIYGAMVAAWGNAPSNPPTYECVRVFDSTGQRLITTGVCSGTYAQFRVSLAPGHYLVDKSFSRGLPSVPLKAPPSAIAVDVAPGQWVDLPPKALPGPVP